MKQSEILANRAQEVLLDGHWIAQTNFKAIITSTAWEDAVKQIASFNTIAALTYHVGYYLEGVSQVLKGGPLVIKDKYSFDMPSIASESDWARLKGQFLDYSVDFVHSVAQLSDDQLNAVFVKEEYGTYLRSIDGMIEHSYYHLGQMKLIQKMLEAGIK